MGVPLSRYAYVWPEAPPAIPSHVPAGAHWSWGGGWLFRYEFLDYAGSSIVHLQGACAAAAGTIVLGPRIGRFVDGKPQKLAGHSMILQVRLIRDGKSPLS